MLVKRLDQKAELSVGFFFLGGGGRGCRRVYVFSGGVQRVGRGLAQAGRMLGGPPQALCSGRSVSHVMMPFYHTAPVFWGQSPSLLADRILCSCEAHHRLACVRSLAALPCGAPAAEKKKARLLRLSAMLRVSK